MINYQNRGLSLVKESDEKDHDEANYHALGVDEVSGSENEQRDVKMQPKEHFTPG